MKTMYLEPKKMVKKASMILSPKVKKRGMMIIQERAKAKNPNITA